VYRDKEGADYINNHYREGSQPDGSVYKDEAIHSVTGLIGQFDAQILPWERQNMEVASAKGTFAHKIAEILGKNKTYNLHDIDD
jgi:hypothetical protein